MPLSEHEQRMLQQMEQALYSADPKFAESLNRGSVVPAARGLAATGALLFLAGIGGLFAGVAIPFVPAGVAGFVVALIGAVLFHGATKKVGGAIRPSMPSVGKGAKPNYMGRLEERWRRRQQRDNRAD